MLKKKKEKEKRKTFSRCLKGVTQLGPNQSEASHVPLPVTVVI